ncbi:hypothetical protein JW859_08380 [bacterium]|nr:hypothetical protein [bacterium]
MSSKKRNSTYRVFAILLAALFCSIIAGCGGNSATLNIIGDTAAVTTSDLPAPDLIKPLLTAVEGIHIAGGSPADRETTFIEGSELTGTPDGDVLLTYKHFEHKTNEKNQDVGYYYPKYWPEKDDPLTLDVDEGISPAYKYYLWTLPGSIISDTINFDWDIYFHVPGETIILFKVQLANINTNTWVEFEEGDGFLTASSLTVADFSPFLDNNQLLMRVELDSTASITLSLKEISINTITLAGTGESYYSDYYGVAKTFYLPEELPSQVDLSIDCAPCRSQSSAYTCVSWSVVDGALNYELQKIYGDLGWDNTDVAFMLSPRYIHVKSADCTGPGGTFTGTYHEHIMNYLVNYGCATEEMVPYISPSDPDFDNPEVMPDIYNPTPTEIAERIPEKILSLDCEKYWKIGKGDIKTVLAFQSRPVMCTNNEEDHALCIVGYDNSTGLYKVRNSNFQSYRWIEDSEISYFNFYILYEEYDPLTESLFLDDDGSNISQYPAPIDVNASMGTDRYMIKVSWSLPPTNRWNIGSKYAIHRDVYGNVIAQVTDCEYVDIYANDGLSHSYWIEAIYDSSNRTATRPIIGWATGEKYWEKWTTIQKNANPTAKKEIAIGMDLTDKLLLAWKESDDTSEEIYCAQQLFDGQTIFANKPLVWWQYGFTDFSVATTSINVSGVDEAAGVLYHHFFPDNYRWAEFSSFAENGTQTHSETSTSPFLTTGPMKCSIRIQEGTGDWYIAYPNLLDQYSIAYHADGDYGNWSTSYLGSLDQGIAMINRTDLTMLNGDKYTFSTNDVPWRFVASCDVFNGVETMPQAYYCTGTTSTFTAEPIDAPGGYLYGNHIDTAFLDWDNSMNLVVPNFVDTVSAPICFTASRVVPIVASQVSAVKAGVSGWEVECVEDCFMGGANKPEYHGAYGKALAVDECFPICVYLSGVQDTLQHVDDHGDLKLAYKKDVCDTWKTITIDESPVGEDLALYIAEYCIYVLYTKREIDGSNSVVLWACYQKEL